MLIFGGNGLMKGGNCDKLNDGLSWVAFVGVLDMLKGSSDCDVESVLRMPSVGLDIEKVAATPGIS